MAFKASPSSQHQHCTDEAQKAETVLSAVIYIYIYIYIICTKENRLPTDRNFIQTLRVSASAFIRGLTLYIYIYVYQKINSGYQISSILIGSLETGYQLIYLHHQIWSMTRHEIKKTG